MLRMTRGEVGVRGLVCPVIFLSCPPHLVPSNALPCAFLPYHRLPFSRPCLPGRNALRSAPERRQPRLPTNNRCWILGFFLSPPLPACLPLPDGGGAGGGTARNFKISPNTRTASCRRRKCARRWVVLTRSSHSLGWSTAKELVPSMLRSFGV